MTATEQVILVDENDQAIGTAPKLYAHEQALRHRAFSIFIFLKNHPGRILLQQRALHKYHTPGLWTNACCSHPRPGEDILAAGARRLQEELGLQSELKSLGWFHYIAPFPNGLTENEIDHVLVGTVESELVEPNPEEVHAVRWIEIADLQAELQREPTKFTPWLSKALELVTASR